MKYDFYNAGNVYSFNPKRPVYDVREGGRKLTALEFHTELVKDADRTDCYICDEKGNIIVKSSKPVSHVRVDWRKGSKKKK